MAEYSLGRRSQERLVGVHPKLVDVVALAITKTEQDFSVLEGVRDLVDQKRYFDAGASKTMNSKHLLQKDGWAHAVDLGAYVAGQIRWDWPLYDKIAAAMFDAAEELEVDIAWGGNWTSFKDGPHFELV